MATTICSDIFGNLVPVSPEALIFRPAVYGIFIENNQAFLLKHPQTELLYPPGHLLGEDETPTQAIRHQFRDLTGMTPKIGALIFLEDRYFVDDDHRAWHISALYYALERPKTAVNQFSEVDDSKKPEWIHLDNLQRHQMQFGFEAIQAGRLQLKM